MDGTVYLVSDTHFGAPLPGGEERRRQFLRWLASLDDATHLYLLGDIFDFWVDYPHFMPRRHLAILMGLQRLRDRGVEMSFVGGNHDVWCGRFLQEELGICTLSANSVVEHQGVRLRLNHGDGLLAGDRSYKLFRSLVRNRVGVALAKSIHPEILQLGARWLSHTSRDTRDHDEAAILRLIHRYAATHDHSDVDYLVIGHVHVPVVLAFEGWSFACSGDWVQHRSAGRLRDGRLEVFDAGGGNAPGDDP